MEEGSGNHQLALVTTGFTMGLLHVLAGPDHLSALAALAVGTSWKAFMLGFRWGVGHSTGLIVVAVVFISLKGDLDLRRLGRYCDFIVGMFMIALGCYGVLGALKMYREKRNKRDPDLKGDLKDLGTLEGGNTHPDASTSTIDRLINVESDSELDDPTGSAKGTGMGMGMGMGMSGPAPYDHDHHDHHRDLIEACPLVPFIDMHDPSTQRIISFSIGLLHGVAGPGGILGVLPAVEMQNWQSSCLYLGTFIITSTLSMGTFAALYGEATRRIGATAESVELGLSIFSASMSIIVGTIWLVLSLLGKLETLFHR